MNSNNPGFLKIGEYHPSADSAMVFIKGILLHPNSIILKEAISSQSISGNRLCEICLETLERIERGDAVSDRYILGLAWFLKDFTYDYPEQIQRKKT